MTASSPWGLGLIAPDDSFYEDEPVSSWRALETFNNLLHYTDEFAQTRINWTAVDEDGVFLANHPARDVAWSQPFLLSWLAPNKPAGIDLCIQGDADVIARVVPNSYPLGAATAPSLFVTALSPGAGSPATYLHQPGDPNAAAAIFEGWVQPAAIQGSDSNIYQPRVCLVRLELIIPWVEAASKINAVCLREFA